MRPRLDTVAPHIVAALQKASPPQLRRAAAAAATFAVRATGLGTPRLSAAEVALHTRTFGETPERRALELLTQELDEVQFDLQDRVQEGAATQAEQHRAFRRARAAAAVWSALAADPLEAALEAIYEAQAALEEPAELWTVVQRALDAPAP